MIGSPSIHSLCGCMLYRTMLQVHTYTVHICMCLYSWKNLHEEWHTHAKFYSCTVTMLISCKDTLVTLGRHTPCVFHGRMCVPMSQRFNNKLAWSHHPKTQEWTHHDSFGFQSVWSWDDGRRQELENCQGEGNWETKTDRQLPIPDSCQLCLTPTHNSPFPLLS